MTCSPQFVGGPEASQNGFGQRIRRFAKLVRQISHAAIPCAARFPSATASTTSLPPFTQSPPAKYFGLEVCPVSASTTTRPFLRSTLLHCSRNCRSRVWPMDGIKRSHSMEKSNPRPVPDGAGPMHPGRPVPYARTLLNPCESPPAASASETGCRAALRVRIQRRRPAFHFRPDGKADAPLRPQQFRRIRRVNCGVAAAHHHHRRPTGTRCPLLYAAMKRRASTTPSIFSRNPRVRWVQPQPEEDRIDSPSTSRGESSCHFHAILNPDAQGPDQFDFQLAVQPA